MEWQRHAIAFGEKSMCEVFNSCCILCWNAVILCLRIFAWHFCAVRSRAQLIHSRTPNGCSSAAAANTNRVELNRKGRKNEKKEYNAELMFIKGEKWAHRQRMWHRIAVHGRECEARKIKNTTAEQRRRRRRRNVPNQYGLHVNKIFLLHFLHSRAFNSFVCFVSISLFLPSALRASVCVFCAFAFTLLFLILTSTAQNDLFECVWMRWAAAQCDPCTHIPIRRTTLHYESVWLRELCI